MCFLIFPLFIFSPTFNCLTFLMMWLLSRNLFLFNLLSKVLLMYCFFTTLARLKCYSPPVSITRINCTELRLIIGHVVVQVTRIEDILSACMTPFYDLFTSNLKFLQMPINRILFCFLRKANFIYIEMKE